jgi:hypothetical protein
MIRGNNGESHLNTGCRKTERSALVHACNWSIGARSTDLVCKNPSTIAWFAKELGSKIDIIKRNTSNAHGKHPSYTQLPGKPVVNGGGVVGVFDEK